MLDETIITETPPLYNCYSRIGEQCQVLITGNRGKRILHGVINIHTGSVVLLITEEWNQQTHQVFLHMIRAHWRGWNIVLFEDRGSPHKADESLGLAARLGMQIRLLPKATPELNAMDHLWRQVKGWALANGPMISVDKLADNACRYILEMSPHERLQKAGVFSGDFWLTT
jgi:DDE superfamily endonuclease